MYLNSIQWPAGIALLLLLLFSCNDPTTVGAGIVDEEVVEIDKVSLPLTLIQTIGDPFVTYPDQAQLNRAQCGKIEDEVFGRTEAGFYMQMIPAESFVKVEESYVIDSVRLLLFLDSSGTYGELGPLTLSVDRIEEVIDGTRSHLSDAYFNRGEKLVEHHRFTPVYAVIDTISESPPEEHVRISIDHSLADEVLSLDSLVLNNDSAFVENIGGIYVYGSGQENQIVGFHPYTTGSAVRSGIYIWYRNHPDDTTNVVLSLQSFASTPAAPAVPVYRHDYTGSAVQWSLDHPGQDSFLYVQGMGGAQVDLIIDSIDELSDILINKAELFIPLADWEDVYKDRSPIRTLFMTFQTLSSGRQWIPEFQQFGLFSQSPIGRLDSLDGQAGYYYNIPISSDRLMNRTVFDSKIKLQNWRVPIDANTRAAIGSRNLSESIARSVIRGRHDQDRLYIELTFSR